MAILDGLMQAGREAMAHIGGAEGAQRLLSLLDGGVSNAGGDPAGTPGDPSVAQPFLEEAQAHLSRQSAPELDEIGHALTAFLGRFHNSTADAASVRAHAPFSSAGVFDLLESVVRVSPSFFADVVRFILRGAPSGAANEAGPASWLISLLKVPAVGNLFRSVLESASQRVMASTVGSKN